MNKNKAWGGVTLSRGFTLIELLAVIVILAIIALIATPIVLDIIDSAKKSSVEATMKNIEKAALLEYSDLALTNEEKEEIIYNCYDGKCTYNGKTLNVKGDMPDRGRIIVNEAGATFENIIIKGYNCIKNNNKFTCNNTGLTKVNGTSILIDNNKTTEIENYRIYGNSIQNGEPTPDTPVEVESVGDLVTLNNCENYGSDACNNIGKYIIPIKVTGKNLFDISKIVDYIDGNYISRWTAYGRISNDIITSNYGVYKDFALLFDSKKIFPAGNYTLSANYMKNKDSGNKQISIGIKDMTNNTKKNRWGILSNYNIWEKFSFNFELTKTTEIAVHVQGLGQNNDSSELNIKIKDIQIEYGDKATEYEPYKETITNIYLDEPLRKVGDYSDYIDFKTGKVIRNIKQMVLNGSESWTYDSNFNVFKFLNNEFMTRQQPISNQLNGIASGILYNDNALLINDDAIYVTKKDLGDNLESFKDGLGQNNLVFINVLKHSLEQTLDLPKLSINKDTSVISVNTSVVPSNIELEYYR